MLFFRAQRSLIAIVGPFVFDPADGIDGREVIVHTQLFGFVPLLFGLVVIEVLVAEDAHEELLGCGRPCGRKLTGRLGVQ